MTVGSSVMLQGRLSLLPPYHDAGHAGPSLIPLHEHAVYVALRDAQPRSSSAAEGVEHAFHLRGGHVLAAPAEGVAHAIDERDEALGVGADLHDRGRMGAAMIGAREHRPSPLAPLLPVQHAGANC